MKRKKTFVQQLNRIQKLTDCYLLAFNLKSSPESFLLALDVMSNSLCKENSKEWRVRFSALKKTKKIKDIVLFLKEASSSLWEEYLEICNICSQRKESLNAEEAEAFQAAFAELFRASNAGLIDNCGKEIFCKKIEEAVLC